MDYTTKIGEGCVEVECKFEWFLYEDDWGKTHGDAYVEEVWYQGVDIIDALDIKQIEKIQQEIDEKPASYWND